MNSKFIAILILITLILISIQEVSAYTYLNIYIDKEGNAEFLGETNEDNESLILPSGIEIKNGDIIGKTQELTNKQGEIWEFYYELKNGEMNVVLPKGAVIKSIENGEVSVNKNHIGVYSQEKVSFSYTIKNLSEFNVYWIILAIFAFTVIVYIYLNKVLMKNIRKKNITKNHNRKYSKTRISNITKSQNLRENDRKKKLETIKEILNDREKKIIEILEHKEHGIKSSQLRKLSEIPKASFSRHIQELQKKDLIKRQGVGRNKLVSLK